MKNKTLLLLQLFLLGALVFIMQKSDKLHKLEVLNYENRLTKVENRYLNEKERHEETKLELAYVNKILSDKGEQVNVRYLGKYTATAYCGCEICCGEHALNRPNGIVYGAAGIELQEGISIASPLPIGTKLIVEGNKYTVQDKTAEWIEEKYEDKIIDFYFTNHSDAESFGKQIKDVYVIE